MGANKNTAGDMEKRSFLKKSDYPTDDETVIVSMRIHKARKQALTEHFQRQGLGLTAGIRQVIYNWMDNY